MQLKRNKTALHKYPGTDMPTYRHTIVAHDLDILVVTESWHSSSADVPVLRAAPPGYSFCDLPREAEDTEEAGGPAPQNHEGIVVYFKSIYSSGAQPFPAAGH